MTKSTLIIILLLLVNWSVLQAQNKDKYILLKSGGKWEYVDSGEIENTSEEQRISDFDVDTESKNQIKINLLPLFFGNPQISYERTINDRFTIGGSVNGFIFKGSPSFIDLGEFNEISFSGDELSGFGIMPQFKWYPNLSDRKTPHGFYLGGLIRYQNIEYKTDALYEDATSTVDFNFDTQLNSFGVGIEVGYQIKFKNNILLDFSFFGPRYVFNTISFSANTELSDDILDALTQEVNNAVGIDVFNTDLDTIDLDEKENFSSLGFRYAISLGYSF